MKFVDYRSVSGHYYFLLKNDRHKSDVTYVTNDDVSIKSSVMQFLYKLHHSRINKYFNLPFKNLWFKCFVPNTIDRNSDFLCFVITPSVIISYGESFVDYLRSRYNCRVALVLGDKVAIYPKEFDVNHLKSVVDLVCTYNSIDSEHYGIKLHPSVVYDLEIKNEKNFSERSIDVLFVGQEKGRGETIVNLYHKCVDLGLKCDFNIIGETKQPHQDGINYCSWIPYSEVFEKLKNSKCIINILQPGASGITMRDTEAYNMGCYLMTSMIDPELEQILNNGQIIGLDFFNKNLAEQIKARKEKFPRKTITNTVDNFYNWIEKSLQA